MREVAFGALVFVLGCGEAASAPRVSAAAGAAGAPSAPDESLGWAWAPCGSIPSGEVLPSPDYVPGAPFEGGHPRPPADSEPLYGITSLAISGDGLTLASMGGVLLAWDIAPVFSDSRASYISSAIPERPIVDVSPDGRWLAISGDGRYVLSRLSPERLLLGSTATSVPCFPIGFRFSPDGQWLAGPGWSGTLDVFRTADLDALMSDESWAGPAVTLASNCGAESSSSGGRVAARVAFTPDGETLLTETGARYRTDNWQAVKAAAGAPLSHGLRGGLEVSAQGEILLSDCDTSQSRYCSPHGAPFPKFCPEGKWIVAGATLSHLGSGVDRVLDATALVGIFAPNGDVIAAAADNTLTRYCRNVP